ncbi:MAG: type II toxin-antitoxin system Phd/YefM family antitoxin [Chthoniobacterales bacterium]
MSPPIQISIRELHARTGHYVRKAAQQRRVIITDHGKPIAEMQPKASAAAAENPWKTRKLRAAFKESMKRGAFRPKPGEPDITDLISEDRDGR